MTVKRACYFSQSTHRFHRDLHSSPPGLFQVGNISVTMPWWVALWSTCKHVVFTWTRDGSLAKELRMVDQQITHEATLSAGFHCRSFDSTKIRYHNNDSILNDGILKEQKTHPCFSDAPHKQTAGLSPSVAVQKLV